MLEALLSRVTLAVAARDAQTCVKPPTLFKRQLDFLIPTCHWASSSDPVSRPVNCHWPLLRAAGEHPRARVQRAGRGIAAACCPREYAAYQAHCVARGATALAGTCLLIPCANAAGHDVPCLFTSRAYERRKDGREQILDAMRRAVADLEVQNVGGKALHAWWQIQLGAVCAAVGGDGAVLYELGAQMIFHAPEGL
ncbi:hypothetical protein HDZ31DRAFT_64420 [Schizophyllum fasciatum]